MKIACKNFIGAAVMVALLGAGYTASASAAEMNHHGAMSSDLRTGLNSLFREHVFLAAGATGAALAGRRRRTRPRGTARSARRSDRGGSLRLIARAACLR